MENLSLLTAHGAGGLSESMLCIKAIAVTTYPEGVTQCFAVLQQVYEVRTVALSHQCIGYGGRI